MSCVTFPSFRGQHEGRHETLAAPHIIHVYVRVRVASREIQKSWSQRVFLWRVVSSSVLVFSFHFSAFWLFDLAATGYKLAFLLRRDLAQFPHRQRSVCCFVQSEKINDCCRIRSHRQRGNSKVSIWNFLLSCSSCLRISWSSGEFKYSSKIRYGHQFCPRPLIYVFSIRVMFTLIVNKNGETTFTITTKCLDQDSLYSNSPTFLFSVLNV